MARRLYLMQRFPDTVLDPDGGLTLPRFALINGQRWRGFGAYNDDGSLASPTPTLPDAAAALPIRDDWYLLCVEATVWTWFDTQVTANRGRRLLDAPFTRTLTVTERNGLRAFLAGKPVDVAFTNGEFAGVILQRLARFNARITASGIDLDPQALWNSLDLVENQA